MKKKSINFLPILITLVSAGVFKCYLDRDNSFDKSIILHNTNDIVDLDSSYDDCTMSTNYTTDITTSKTTVYETTTVTATTESIYKDIMFLNGIDDNYDIYEINDLIVKYSSYSDLSYDDAVSILKDGFDISDYNSLEDAIMRTIFDKGCDLGLISTYCANGSKKTRKMTRDEQESIMIDMCNVMGISNDYKKIVLAVFRWETGNGTSYRCVNDNNYGGIRVGKNFGIYQTPEFGIYRAIKCIYGHILKSNKKGYYDVNGVVNDMSYRYCFDNASEWSRKINGMVKSVSNYYSNFDEKSYTKKYEG